MRYPLNMRRDNKRFHAMLVPHRRRPICSGGRVAIARVGGDADALCRRPSLRQRKAC